MTTINGNSAVPGGHYLSKSNWEIFPVARDGQERARGRRGAEGGVVLGGGDLPHGRRHLQDGGGGSVSRLQQRRRGSRRYASRVAFAVSLQ